MEKAYKFRLYPTKKQAELINKTFGCCRFVYNYYLDRRIREYKDNNRTMSYYDTTYDLKYLKSEYSFLKEVDSTSLQSSLKNLDRAYTNFFKLHSGFPKFKSKKLHYDSYTTRYVSNNIEFLGKYIKLPKIGNICIKNRHIPQGRIINATVSRTPSGRYYVSVCCKDVVINPLPKTDRSIGMDLGVRNFATLSNGKIISSYRYLQRNLDKLARLQKSLSRKTRDSHNRDRARIKIARLQEHISNQRMDFLQKLSTDMVRTYDVICMEDISVRELITKNSDISVKRKRHNFNRSQLNVSWNKFSNMLEYKCRWYDRTLIKTDKSYPSSEICSACGNINTEIKDVSIEKWICPNCCAEHNRDINAAINIHNEGLRLLLNV